MPTATRAVGFFVLEGYATPMNFWKHMWMAATLSACTGADATQEPPTPPVEPPRVAPPIEPHNEPAQPGASRIELAGPGFAPVLSNGTAAGRCRVRR